MVEATGGDNIYEVTVVANKGTLTINVSRDGRAKRKGLLA